MQEIGWHENSFQSGYYSLYPRVLTSKEFFGAGHPLDDQRPFDKLYYYGIFKGELIKLCNRELNWKKPTTYTVLRKLCERGIFQNKDSVVTSLISKEDFERMQCESFVDETFDGALPAFVAAFTKRRKLTPSEIAPGFLNDFSGEFAWTPVDCEEH
ncbi:MAG: BlaI/MecI/CopY family transcriptional regulator, partial [Lachnospiraceae bacterium]|nr:BlaI/MecI/CopY family transcriptional regulator [Lachnospiraceae bacterium]